MKLLAIADHYIPPDFMRSGLASLAELGVEIEVRHWTHASLIDLQHADHIAVDLGAIQLVG